MMRTRDNCHQKCSILFSAKVVHSLHEELLRDKIQVHLLT